MDCERLNAPRELTAEELDMVAGGVIEINYHDFRTGNGDPNLQANSVNTPAAGKGLLNLPDDPKLHGAVAQTFS